MSEIKFHQDKIIRAVKYIINNGYKKHCIDYEFPQIDKEEERICHLDTFNIIPFIENKEWTDEEYDRHINLNDDKNLAFKFDMITISKVSSVYDLGVFIYQVINMIKNGIYFVL